jgi:hypothetical protein
VQQELRGMARRIESRRLQGFRAQQSILDPEGHRAQCSQPRMGAERPFDQQVRPRIAALRCPALIFRPAVQGKHETLAEGDLFGAVEEAVAQPAAPSRLPGRLAE